MVLCLESGMNKGFDWNCAGNTLFLLGKYSAQPSSRTLQPPSPLFRLPF